MNVELEKYLNREECVKLTGSQKQLLRRYVQLVNTDYPIGRRLANGLMKLNSTYPKGAEPVRQDFINWLYYY